MRNPGWTIFTTEIQLTADDNLEDNYKKYVIFSPFYKPTNKGLCLELKEQEFSYTDSNRKNITVKIWFKESPVATYQGWRMKASSSDYSSDDAWLRGNDYGENICLLMIKDS